MVSSSLSAIPLKVNDLKATANDFIDNNKTALAIGGAGAAGIVVGGIIGSAIAKSSSKSKKKKSKSKTAKRKPVYKRKTTKRKYRYARTAGKRKDTSHKRIRMTKNGQPYIILASGKARFIKKSSARLSRKRKGGRY